MTILMPLRYSIGDPRTTPPKAMFQLSGFYYKPCVKLFACEALDTAERLGIPPGQEGFRVSQRVSLGFGV